mgnify:CR=1 FL=1
MKLIVWLWNPWDKYMNTRHNLGFLYLDNFKEKNDFSDFKFESKFKWEVSTWIINWDKILLLKPQTFMNLSWESVWKIMTFYKLDSEDILVIYDDMSLDFWKIRFRDKWSAGWHNWVKDIIKYLWEKWNRIKVWVGLNDKYEVSDRVLSKFTEEELIDLDNEVFPEVDKLLNEKI